MRKFVSTLLVVVLILSVACAAYAIHERMVFPYDGAMGHYEKMPNPEGGDVRHYITSHSPYKKAFKLWTGKGEMYMGKEPHGALLTTYVNDIASESINKMKGMQNNSLIVKENYAPNKKLVAVSVMYKVQGYNPEGGDWYWAQYDADFKVLTEGKAKACIDCHVTAKDNDYIFTGKVTK